MYIYFDRQVYLTGGWGADDHDGEVGYGVANIHPSGIVNTPLARDDLGMVVRSKNLKKEKMKHAGC